jgi:iron complex outermembrane receptor protein
MGRLNRSRLAPVALLLLRAAFAHGQEAASVPEEPEPAQAVIHQPEAAASTPVEADPAVIHLPEAAVTEKKETSDIITAADMERDNSADLWEAVRYTPGVILSGGGRRNDSSFTVRGFGADSVPLFVDGIYVANTYRGESDSARVLTGDLESIEIQKGYSSMLLGSNTLGGAILLRTARPREPFEASVKTGVEFDSIGKFSAATDVVKAGTKQEYYYGMGIFQYRGVDHWRLPADFEPDKLNPQEPGDRLWSDSTDMKLTLLAGWTPLAPLDLSVTYTYQDADKGLSPPDVARSDYYIWDWPIYDRWSLAFNGSWTANTFFVKTLAYYDKYDNRMDEYMDLLNLEMGYHQAHSDYDEYSEGLRIEGGWDINPQNSITAAFTYRKDNHTGLSDGEEVVRVEEDTWSAGIEYALKPWKPLTLTAGLGYDALVPIEFWGALNEQVKAHEGAGYYVVKTRTMQLLSWQVGVFYDITAKQELHLTWAVKNRFPTMFQRYSTRQGSVIPNPRLGPETANHFELGHRGYFFDKLRINTALYYSLILDKIVTIKVPNPEYGARSSTVNYTINLDETAMWGFELGLTFLADEKLDIGGSFAVNKYEIRHSENEVRYLTYYPEITAGMYVEWRPVASVSIIPRIEYLAPRYADTDGVDELEEYTVFNIKAEYEVNKHLSFSASIENLLDTYYEIKQYAPMPGRTYTLSATVKY